MLSKRVKQILGIGVIIVVIAGVVFLFTRLNKPVEEPEPMQTAPKFLTEETVDNPELLVEEEEERTWEEVVSKEDLWLKAINDTYLFAEPFSDAKTVVKVPINKELDELACCFQGNQSMGWSKVSYDGTTGYIDMRDAEYIIEEEEEVTEPVEESSGVSDEEQHSIVEVNEPDETAKVDEPTATPEPTPTPQPTEEPKADVTPAPSAQPAPTETPNPNVTTKTAAEKQAEVQQEALRMLEELGGSQDIPNGHATDIQGNGTHFGDAQ